jgi:hypothetical protein
VRAALLPGLGFRVQGSGFRVQGKKKIGFRVKKIKKKHFKK